MSLHNQSSSSRPHSIHFPSPSPISPSEFLETLSPNGGDDSTSIIQSEPTATGELGAKPDYSAQKIVVAMVGLPARGKSYLSNRLMRYLRVSSMQRRGGERKVWKDVGKKRAFWRRE